MVLLRGSSPILTFWDSVCWLRFRMEKPNLVLFEKLKIPEETERILRKDIKENTIVRILSLKNNK